MQQCIQDEFFSKLAKLWETLPLFWWAQRTAKQVVASRLGQDNTQDLCPRSFTCAFFLGNCCIFFFARGDLLHWTVTFSLKRSAAPQWDHRPLRLIIGFFYYSPKHANQMASGAQIFAQQRKLAVVPSRKCLTPAAASVNGTAPCLCPLFHKLLCLHPEETASMSTCLEDKKKGILRGRETMENLLSTYLVTRTAWLLFRLICPMALWR